MCVCVCVYGEVSNFISIFPWITILSIWLFCCFPISYLGFNYTRFPCVFIICRYAVVALASIGARIARRLEMMDWLLFCVCALALFLCFVSFMDISLLPASMEVC